MEKLEQDPSVPKFLLSICVNKVQILVWYDYSLVLCFATIHAFDALND